MVRSPGERAHISQSIIPLALGQHATKNIDMAIKPEEGEKLERGRIQFALPMRAKTRKQTITPDRTQGMVISVTQSSKIEFADWLGVIGTTRRRGTCFSQK